MVWNIGNTTVRNPSRIQEGLKLFAQEFNGDVDGSDRERVFWNRLIEAEIVDTDAKTDSDWNGRKWRSCFVKLGFISGKKYSAFATRKIDLTTLADQKIGL